MNPSNNKVFLYDFRNKFYDIIIKRDALIFCEYHPLYMPFSSYTDFTMISRNQKNKVFCFFFLSLEITKKLNLSFIEDLGIFISFFLVPLPRRNCQTSFTFSI